MIELYVPGPDELGFRQRLLGDPATMGYNAGCGLDMPTYHNDTGCIDFPREAWEGWYGRWVLGGPEKFYAYLRADGEFVGDVCLHMTDRPGIYEMGIVIEAGFIIIKIENGFAYMELPVGQYVKNYHTGGTD